MLTPHHIFGPAGGFDRDYAFAELKGLFDEMQGVSLSGAARIRSIRMLDVKGTNPRDWIDRRADLAVFVIENAANVAVLPLARNLPKVGEPVWLLSPVSGLQGLRHAAQITVSSEAIMNWTYAAAGMSLAGTSGAPVVNERGEVVAMNLGVRAEGATRIGLGGSATSIAKRLEAA